MNDDEFSDLTSRGQKRSSYTEPMIEVRFKSDQKVRPLLRPAIALRSLRGDKCLICIFRKRGRVQRECRARHDKLGERLFLYITWLTSQKWFFSSQIEGGGDKIKSWILHTFNSFELVSMHSFMHVSRKST